MLTAFRNSGLRKEMTLSPNHKKEKALKILFEKSFKYNTKPIFQLASGISSHYYIDCKTAFSYPEARSLFGELIFERLANVEAEAIGGLIIGAYPLAISASDIAFNHKRLLRVIIVRKDPKVHGLKKIIEGDVKKGDRVVIVDDVVTTGSSTIDAIKKSRDAGLEVVKVIALIDRQEENGKENIQKYNVDFESIFTIDDFRKLLNERKTETANRSR
jgi:orotate phosphoribosyltransferase